jgi:hypothetical protein
MLKQIIIKNHQKSHTQPVDYPGLWLADLRFLLIAIRSQPTFAKNANQFHPPGGVYTCYFPSWNDI